jgi:hypothetical protein
MKVSILTAFAALSVYVTAAFAAPTGDTEATIFKRAITTTLNPSAAPTGTHLQTGTVGCSVSSAGVVTCNSYELAGVGNANAAASLSVGYTATVQCKNHGGQIVDVKTRVVPTTTSSGDIAPKNGRLTVPSLSSTAPTDTQIKNAATCPNTNWSKVIVPGSLAVASFTYTLHFTGFTGNYITITGP